MSHFILQGLKMENKIIDVTFFQPFLPLSRAAVLIWFQEMFVLQQMLLKLELVCNLLQRPNSMIGELFIPIFVRQNSWLLTLCFSSIWHFLQQKRKIMDWQKHISNKFSFMFQSQLKNKCGSYLSPMISMILSIKDNKCNS